jgi:hypothetical protein
MASAQTLLSAADTYITSKPKITYFNPKYEEADTELRKTFEIPFDNSQTNFGTSATCTIPVKGDLLTGLTLKTVLPAIFTPQTGAYVYPSVPSQVSAGLYVQMPITLISGDSVAITVTIAKTHFFSVGASVTLSGTTYNIYNLDGTYTIASVPTPTTFTCLTPKSGVSFSGTATTLGLIPGFTVPYYSTTNYDTWVINKVNQSFTATNVAGNILYTSTSPIGLLPGQLVKFLSSTNTSKSGNYTVATSPTSSTFTLTGDSSTATPAYVAMSSSGGFIYSPDNINWTPSPSSISANLIIKGNKFLAVGSTTVYTSTDTITWTTVTRPSGNWTWLNTNGTSLYFLLGYDSTAATIVSYSTDAISWSTPYVLNPTFCAFQNYGTGTYFTGTTYVIATEKDTIAGRLTFSYSEMYYSIDSCVTWTLNTAFTDVIQITDMISAGGYVVMCATDVNRRNSLTRWVNTVYYSATPTSTFTVSYTFNILNTAVSGDDFRFRSIAYGNGAFVVISKTYLLRCPLTDIALGSAAWIDQIPAGSANAALFSGLGAINITFINNLFFITGLNYNYFMYSSDGITWLSTTTFTNTWQRPLYLTSQTYISYFTENSLNVSYNSTQSGFTFSSQIYSSIYFNNAIDAAFWGFDYRQGPSYNFVNGKVSSQWNLQQGGWISGYTPASNLNYKDSVGNLVITNGSLSIGKQLIHEYTGEYIELLNDVTVPYENQAILKLLYGKFDTTQSIVSRTYYTPLPLGCDSLPLYALKRQDVSLEMTFSNTSSITSYSRGSGFFSSASYSAIRLPTSETVITTRTIYNYIFFVTSSGNIYSYDGTTFNVINVSSAYDVINIGDSLFIQTSTGNLIRGSVTQFTSGNFSQFTINFYNFSPSAAASMSTDGRYLYYTQTTSITRYDTQSDFFTSTSYSTFNLLTSLFGTTVTGILSVIFTGSAIYMFTSSTNIYYYYALNTPFTSGWVPISYTYASTITCGVYYNNNLYLFADNCRFITINTLTNTTTINTTLVPFQTFIAVNKTNTTIYKTTDGSTWAPSSTTQTYACTAYGGGRYVGVGTTVGYSNDGVTWFGVTNPGGYVWSYVTYGAYGTGVFVAVSSASLVAMYSTNFGTSWNLSTVPVGIYTWRSVAYGAGVFVACGTDDAVTGGVNPSPTVGGICVSINGGQTFTQVSTTIFSWAVVYGNGIFMSTGYSGTYTSLDGSSWGRVSTQQSLTLAYSNKTWTNITSFNTGAFPIISNTTFGYSTDNGVTWQISGPRFRGVYPYGGVGIFPTNMTASNQIFVVTISNNGIYYSYDGINWNKTATSVVATGVNPGLPVASYNWSLIGGSTGFPMTFSNPTTIGSNLFVSLTNSTTSAIMNIDLSASSVSFPFISSATNPPFTITGTQSFGYISTSIYFLGSGTTITKYNTNINQITGVSFSILADFTNTQRKPEYFSTRIIQTKKTNTMYNLGLKNPIKEMWLLGPSTSNVYQYSNISTPVTLNITNNEYLLTSDVGTSTFLGIVTPYETHSTMPQRNFYQLPFEYFPEKHKPNGTINFSRIGYQVMSNVTSVWARSYNVLTIKDGVAGLMFNS